MCSRPISFPRVQLWNYVIFFFFCSFFLGVGCIITMDPKCASFLAAFFFVGCLFFAGSSAATRPWHGEGRGLADSFRPRNWAPGQALDPGRLRKGAQRRRLAEPKAPKGAQRNSSRTVRPGCWGFGLRGKGGGWGWGVGVDGGVQGVGGGGVGGTPEMLPGSLPENNPPIACGLRWGGQRGGMEGRRLSENGARGFFRGFWKSLCFPSPKRTGPRVLLAKGEMGSGLLSANKDH